MGFKDVINFTMKQDPITKGMRPHLDQMERQKMKEALKAMHEEDDD